MSVCHHEKVEMKRQAVHQFQLLEETEENNMSHLLVCAGFSFVIRLSWCWTPGEGDAPSLLLSLKGPGHLFSLSLLMELHRQKRPSVTKLTMQQKNYCDITVHYWGITIFCCTSLQQGPVLLQCVL